MPVVVNEFEVVTEQQQSAQNSAARADEPKAEKQDIELELKHQYARAVRVRAY